MREFLSSPLILGASPAELWTLLAPVLSAFLGGLFVLWIDRRKSAQQHKLDLDYEALIAARQVQRQKLLEAYEKIDGGIGSRLKFLELDPESHFERTQDFGRGMGLVKLFGSEDLCMAVDKFVDMLNGKGSFNEDSFMNALRDELRDHYALPRTESRWKWLDFKKLEQNEAKGAK